MSATTRRSLSASRPRRRHELWALATVLALTLAVAPAVLAAGGDHGACGADWVKFEFSNSGAIGPATWSSPAPSTPAPDLWVTEWKEDTEAVQVGWSHTDAEEPVWTVSQVWLKAGSDQQDDGGLFGPYAGGDSGLAPSDGTTLEKGISFAVFCFDGEPSDPPTDPPTDDPTDPPTDDPTDPPTDDPTDPSTETPTEPAETETPTEPAETETPTEPAETDTEGVLPDEVETTEPEPTETEAVESETVEPEVVEPEAEAPTIAPAEQEQEQVEVLADSLPATGTGTWVLLFAGLLSLAAGTALVRRPT